MILYLTQLGEDIFLDVTDTRLYRIYKIIINIAVLQSRSHRRKCHPKMQNNQDELSASIGALAPEEEAN